MPVIILTSDELSDLSFSAQPSSSLICIAIQKAHMSAIILFDIFTKIPEIRTLSIEASSCKEKK